MNRTRNNPSLLTTRPHFQILDGMRGVAAIAVLIYHFMEMAVPDYHDNFIAHGHLAVDFFYCLSGFVIAYAYDTRIRVLGAWQFFKLRLIRLHPLVFFGAVLGLISFMADPFSELISQYGVMQSIGLFFSSAFLIPYPIVPERYLNFFHLNPPTWSLFWEYVANIFYALVLFRLRNKLLWVLTVIAAILLVNEARVSGNLSVGWGGTNFMGGGIRIFYSFLAGMLVYRSNWVIKSRFGLVSLSLLLFAAFVIPHDLNNNWWVESLVVLVYFPLLIALGAGADTTRITEKAGSFLGELSYPLYMTHYPILWILFSYIQLYKPTMQVLIPVIIIGVLVLIGFAMLVLKFYDEPVRKYLRRSWVEKSK